MSGTEPTADHKNQTAMLSRLAGLGPSGQSWTYSDSTAAGDRPADVATGLVSLAFLRAAIRRDVRLWGAMAIIGLLVGLGVYVASPPAYQASTSVLLTLGPYENANSAPMDNQAIAQSRAVAGLAGHMLGLTQNPASVISDYTVAVDAPDLLKFTASGPSADVAVTRARTVAAAFLRFRTAQLEAEQNLALKSADEQITQVRQELNSISRQISQVSAQATSPAQQAELTKLQTERSQSAATLSTLQQSASSNRGSTATALAVKHSQVLESAAPVFQSRLKRLVPRPAIGFALGLALGLGIVIIRALSSDKLRRRDDVAQALGTPVQLSVGTVPQSRWPPRRRGLAAASGRPVRRMVAYLRSVLPARPTGPAALAVVPVGDPGAAALSLVSLALSCAQQGRQVMVADLVSGMPAARLLHSGQTGVHQVHLNGAGLVVAVPEPDDVAPIGPFGRTARHAQPSSFSDAVADGSASADLLLTLAALDPALDGDHLPTWAADAVVVVTAGKSSWTQIHTAGQMLRLAGLPPLSAVLVGADKHDESLGRAASPGPADFTGPGLGGISR